MGRLRAAHKRSMWEIIGTIAGVLAAVGLFARLITGFIETSRRRRDAPDRLYDPIKPLLRDWRYESDGSAGYPQLVGFYADMPVRIFAVVDTLAVRKLPMLWLLVTIPEPVPVGATLDLMMRPAGPTTFSNFDFLPSVIKTPLGFPMDAVIRTDDPDRMPPGFLIEPYLDVFDDPRAKELLISPKGVRLVWQIAQADRARYGVFRQAEFGDVVLQPERVRGLLDRLVALRQSIIAWNAQAA
jgi:hypothetical protein